MVQEISKEIPMRMSLKSNKAGVSLIAVLLFMLIATIAATATWKWITSEGKSSESRMLQREAYQSAVAGIETARTWMAYHANETGALIKQYKDGGNVPIRLNNLLAELSGGKQNYDIYLVGVNTSGSTYKLKLFSKGTARNGSASHSEEAILNVNGLYRVRIPDQPNNVAVDYTYAYFGGSTTYSGDHKHTSMVINGNWSGNPAGTEGDFIVTGNATLSGSKIEVGATACIGGTLYAHNGFQAQNLYVGGSVTDFNPIISQDAYFEGDVALGSACGDYNFQISGNMTVGGTLTLNECNTRVVEGNTCVLTTGQIVTNGNPVELRGGAWMAADLPIWRVDGDNNSDNDDNYADYANFVVGTDNSSEIYIRTGHSWSEYENLYDSKKFATEVTQVRRCKGAYKNCYYEGNRDKWDGETYEIYPSKASKPGLYYIYALPAGVTDVDYGSYTDSHWGRDLHGFFVNFTTTEDMTTRFTDSHESYSECGQNQPYLNTGKCYRYLNYDGTQMTGSPYCYAVPSDDKYVPKCGVAPWFKVNGSFHSWTSEQPITCAEDVKSHCNDIWHSVPTGTGCDNSNYKVDDMLKTGVRSFSQYANKASCVTAILNRDHNQKINFNVEDLNTCYSTASTHDETSEDKDLYNGYLVVNITDANGGLDLFNNPSGSLTGKFIFMFTSSNNTAIGGAKFPPTTNAQSMVFLYLENGSTGTLVFSNGGNGVSNYFIYTKGDISEIHGYQNINGSVYAEVGNGTCAKISNMNNNTTLIFDRNVVTDMAQNGIICDASATTCGGIVNGDGDDDENHNNNIVAPAFGDFDSYYISVAPQLSVSVESQYKNKEKVPNLNNAETLSGSFIVLPRVVYLPVDAKGQLKDYYNVLPLNAKGSVSNVNVGCDGAIPASGQLTSGGDLAEGYYTCYVSGSVGSEARTVPFWVIVNGAQGNAPRVNFTQNFVQVPIGVTTTVSLSAESESNAVNSCRAFVKFIQSGSDEWTVTAASNEIANSFDASNGWYVIDVAVGDEATPAFTVKNENSVMGSVSFMIVGTDENCLPGDNQNEIVYNKATVTIERADLAAYCAGPGSSDERCASGGEYTLMINQLDCVLNDNTIWVNALGSGCNVSVRNNQWNCGIASDITLQKITNPTGCVAIVPNTNNTISHNDLTTGESYTLYADLKAKRQTFHTGFDVEGTLSGSTAITIFVAGPGTYTATSTCTYNDYLNESTRIQKCDVDVYRGSIVTLSFGDIMSSDYSVPASFNYWKCESGIDCPNNRPDKSQSYQISIVGENTVKAHFGEADKHCFFDEFRTKTSETSYVRGFRNSLACSQTEYQYCVETCDGKCSSVTTSLNNETAKWRFMSKSTASFGDIEIENGKVYLNSSATRGKKESDKQQAIIMSTVVPGLSGKLKAQFQMPVEKLADGDVNKASVRQSGFILRASDDLSQYLMLNVYAVNGDAKARICLNGSNTCTSKSFGATVSPTDIVLLSAEVSETALILRLYPSSWTVIPYTVTFLLNNSTLGGLGALVNYEYVGFALSDPNFKLYGIGWQSEEYESECWDSYPTISCSFKANYAGGIVPKDTEVKPWVGLSPWYSNASGTDCTPESYSPGFWYNGSDNDGCSVFSDYVQCGTGTNYTFNFSESGAHGYRNPTTELLEKNVMVEASHSNSNCLIYGEAAAWAYNGVAANCGEFWVGELQNCSQSVRFDVENGVDGLEGTYYGLGGSTTTTVPKVNLRGARLLVSLESPDVSSLSYTPEIEIYLFSQNSTDGYSYGKDVNIYSLPYKVYGTSYSQTSSSQTLTIPVDAISNAPGFDPENVVGVYVKDVTGGTVNVSSIESDCPDEIALKECSVKNYRLGHWTIEATLKNHAMINDDFTIEVAAKTGSPIPSGDAPTCTSCSWNGDVVSLAWNDANPYGNGTYTFVVKTTLNEVEQSVECSADAPEIEAVCSNNVADVNSYAGLPEFSFSIVGCPSSGCKYKVSLTNNGGVVGSGTYNTTGSVTAGNANNINANGNVLASGSYRYVLENDDSDANTPEFACESNLFNVGVTSSSSEGSSSSEASSSSEESSSSISSPSVESSSSVDPLSVECSIQDQTGQTAGADITVTPHSVSGCGASDCSYVVSADHTLTGASGNTYNGGSVTFSDAAGSGEESYTLTIAHGNASVPCTFKVTYVVSSSSEESSSSAEESSSSEEESSSSVACRQITATFADNEGNKTITGTLMNGCADITVNKICTDMQIEIANCKGKTGTWNGSTFTLNNNDNGYWSGDNPAPRLVNKLDMPDCQTSKINKVYLNNCVYPLQGGKITATGKSYFIPKGTCFDVDAVWDNPSWRPDLWLKCSGKADVKLSIGSDMSIKKSNVCQAGDGSITCLVSN